jgi:broad specificity phosphatase PhoE
MAILRQLEVRRHAQRNTSGRSLSEEGLGMACYVGQSLPEFDLVVTSELRWAIETAVVMGYSIDTKINAKEYKKDQDDEEISQNASPADYAELIKTSSGIAGWAQAQLEYYLLIINKLQEGGKALIISHGGAIDAAAVACFPNANHKEWGPAFGHCEGYYLSFENEMFTNIEIHRIS